MLLDRWFVCKQRIFLSCDVLKGVGYYHEIFMWHLYLNYWNVFSWNKSHETHHKMQRNSMRYRDIRLWCDVTDVNNTELALATRFTANTELPLPELPGVIRLTPARVTLEVAGQPQLRHNSGDKKGASSKANKKALALLLKPASLIPSNTWSSRSFHRDTDKEIKVLRYCEVLQRGGA